MRVPVLQADLFEALLEGSSPFSAAYARSRAVIGITQRKCTVRPGSGSAHSSSASRYGELTSRWPQLNPGSHGSPTETVSPTLSSCTPWK